MSNFKISELGVGTATSSTPFAAVVAGVTDQVTLAPVYTSLAGKAATSHTHVSADITDLVASGLDTQGHCRLQVDSTSSITLQRYQGTTLPIKTGSAWAAMTIPSSGAALSSTGLSADTLYYAYAFNNSGTLNLVASTAARATDATTGVEIMSTDATRTLTGMVFTSTSGNFISGATTKRYLVNWFNKRQLDLEGKLSANRNVASITFVEVHSEIRAEYITWGDEAVSAAISGSASNQTGATSEVLVGLSFDSTTPVACTGERVPTNAVNLHYFGFGLHVWNTQTEGKHYATIVAAHDFPPNPFVFFSTDTPGNAIAANRVRVGIRG